MMRRLGVSDKPGMLVPNTQSQSRLA